MNIKQVIKISALLVLLVSPQVNAASISYYLDKSNVLADGINYAQVSISDGKNGNIDFSVNILESAFSGIGVNFGMQTFSFNFDGSLSLGNISNLNPLSWDVNLDPYNGPYNAGGGFGKFDFEFQGEGSSRTSLLTFSITGVEGDTIHNYAVGSTENEFFAAHIAGFEQYAEDGETSVTSGQFAGSTAVPLPAAAWLLGSGFAGLAWIRKTKNDSRGKRPY